MNEFEDKLNHSLRERIEKYEEELNALRVDYEQNRERIRQDLYQVIYEKQKKSIELENKKKRNKPLQNIFYLVWKIAKRIEIHFRNITKSRKKCEN